MIDFDLDLSRKLVNAESEERLSLLVTRFKRDPPPFRGGGGGGNSISSNNVADPRRDKWVNGRGEGRKARAECGTERRTSCSLGKAGR